MSLKEMISKLVLARIDGKLALVLQNMLFTQLRLFGACPLILPAVAVAIGMFEGGTWGAVISMILGIFADMAFVENTVTFTVLFPLLSFGAGLSAQFFINRRFMGYMLTAFAALLVTALVQSILVALGGGVSVSILGTALLQALFSLPVTVLCYFPPAKWIE